jgi:hypothetical protein
MVMVLNFVMEVNYPANSQERAQVLDLQQSVQANDRQAVGANKVHA